METTITTITAILIVLAMIAAWMAYEMAHAYEQPADEECTTETKDSKETRK